MTSLNLASNNLGAEGAKHVAEAIKVNVSALRFDWYHFELDLTSGSTAVVYGYCYYNTTKGALTSLNLADNRIKAEGAKHVAEAIKGHVSAAVLQFDWHHFELDLTSGSNVVVYGYSCNNTTKGALTSLNISSNGIGELVLPKGWEEQMDSDGFRWI